MTQDTNDNSLKTLNEIRSIMERSARFISLSGWSGVWAGCVALVGAYIAYSWLALDRNLYNYSREPLSATTDSYTDTFFMQLAGLAIAVFLIALAGGYYFTWRKVKKQGGSIWNTASRSMLKAMAVPLLCGAVFCLAFMWYGHAAYFAPACLIFYGLALYNGSRYTLTDIRYLGMLEILLGCICLFMPGYGLHFWTLGFGLLHILYGIIMWNKYDKNGSIKEDEKTD